MRLFPARLLVCSLLCCLPAFGQKAGSPTESRPDSGHEMTAADVEAFLDGFVPMQLQRENIAGAVVCVVKDGKILFAQGYGYSDVAKKTPVTVDATLFRPGSISKLFTWTAVMQLVEQGKLDLDTDINKYLDFKIPATFPQPITLRNIMTHTTGFEENVSRLFLAEDDPMVPLSQYLPKHIPKRIFPPGTTPAYSNYGASLAGYIVERVSGRPFDLYIAEHILQPLGMSRSTFTQPLPADLKPLMSGGYEKASGKPEGFEVVQAAPAGSLSATAADISHFMIAHLQDGRYENAQILKPETAKLMHTRQAALSPDLNAMALGFYEETRNGHRIIGHGGDSQWFHSDLHLMLDTGVGFYVSYNSAGKGEISPRSALWSHFINRYFPWSAPEIPVPASAVADAKSVEGYYMSSRRSDGTFLKAGNAFGQERVIAQADGTLKIEPLKDFNGELKQWHEIGPLVYRGSNGTDRIAFVKDRDGRMQLVVNFPAVVYQKVSAFNNSLVNSAIVGCSIGIMALTLLFLPIAAVIRSHHRVRLELTPRQRGLRRMVRIVCAVDVAFVALFLILLSAASPISLLSGRLDFRITLLQILGTIGAIGSLAVIYATWRLLGERDLWGWSRVCDVVVMFATVGFAWFVVHWNVINFSMNY